MKAPTLPVGDVTEMSIGDVFTCGNLKDRRRVVFLGTSDLDRETLLFVDTSNGDAVCANTHMEPTQMRMPPDDLLLMALRWSDQRHIRQWMAGILDEPFRSFFISEKSDEQLELLGGSVQ